MTETNQDKKRECTSVVSSVRALPSIAGDAIHYEYYNTRGRIVNNLWNEAAGQYQVPTVSGCPTKTYSLNIPRSSDDKTCNILGPNYKCENGSELENRVSLPSLVFLVQNNVECSLNPVSIEDAYCSLTNSRDATACLPKGCNKESACHVSHNPIDPTCVSSYSCEETGGKSVPFEFSSNGILASVYHFFRFRNYGFFRQSDKNIVEFMIRPYENDAITDVNLDKPCNKLEPSGCDTITKELFPKVLGTYPFCIGGKYRCACVNLLLHGGMSRSDEISDVSDPCLISDLYWVSVKFFFKNHKGLICTNRPATVHIEANPKDPLANCFVACFATTRPVVTGFENPNNWPYPIDPTVCPSSQWYPNCTPPVPPFNVPTTPCNGPGQPKCKLLEIIWVSDCVDFEEFDSYNNCKIFVVLLPVTQKCSLLE
jgi:hypothetical protein